MKMITFLLASLLANSAAAAPHGIFWAHGRGPSAQDVSNLKYFGGPVISHVKVYGVFWGDGVDARTKAEIGPYFANILDSGYMDWLSEYDTPTQRIGRGRFAGSMTIEPLNKSAALTDAMIQIELDGQIAAGRLPKADADSLYMIYFPAGISISIESERSCSSFCAYHEGFKSPRDGSAVYYGVMPVCRTGCGFGGSAFDSLAIVSSHECIEAVTDPFPTPGDNPAFPQAWNTEKGQEIGDLCAGGSSTVSGHGRVSPVQWQWDNSTMSCAQGPWTQSGVAENLRELLSVRGDTLWTGH